MYVTMISSLTRFDIFEPSLSLYKFAQPYEEKLDFNLAANVCKSVAVYLRDSNLFPTFETTPSVDITEGLYDVVIASIYMLLN